MEQHQTGSYQLVQEPVIPLRRMIPVCEKKKGAYNMRYLGESLYIAIPVRALNPLQHNEMTRGDILYTDIPLYRIPLYRSYAIAHTAYYCIHLDYTAILDTAILDTAIHYTVISSYLY